jgi:hypothetical protein
MLLLFNTPYDIETGWGNRCIFRALDTILTSCRRITARTRDSSIAPLRRETIKQKDSEFKDNN